MNYKTGKGMTRNNCGFSFPLKCIQLNNLFFNGEKCVLRALTVELHMFPLLWRNISMLKIYFRVIANEYDLDA